MVGIVDVGGGNRGIFGAGVLDYCMEHEIHFDYGIGVSAGAANIASYQGRQPHRNYRFYTVYNLRRQAMSLKNLIRKHSYIDLDYIYGDLTNQDKEDPLDFLTVMAEPAMFVLVATDALRGTPHYFTKNDMGLDHYEAIAASSCVPVINKPYFVNGLPYFDGGISDPIPYRKALEDGCDKLVIILTRPRDSYRKPGKDKYFAGILKKSYPNSAMALEKRTEVYNRQLNGIKALEREGKALIIAPDSIGRMKTLNKDIEGIKRLYNKGLCEARQIQNFMKAV